MDETAITLCKENDIPGGQRLTRVPLPPLFMLLRLIMPPLLPPPPLLLLLLPSPQQRRSSFVFCLQPLPCNPCPATLAPQPPLVTCHAMPPCCRSGGLQPDQAGQRVASHPGRPRSRHLHQQQLLGALRRGARAQPGQRRGRGGVGGPHPHCRVVPTPHCPLVWIPRCWLVSIPHCSWCVSPLPLVPSLVRAPLPALRPGPPFSCPPTFVSTQDPIASAGCSPPLPVGPHPLPPLNSALGRRRRMPRPQTPVHLNQFSRRCAAPWLGLRTECPHK